MSKQNRKRLIDTENRLMVARWEEAEGLGEDNEGVNKYKSIVTE